jgi:hypothetical protein
MCPREGSVFKDSLTGRAASLEIGRSTLPRIMSGGEDPELLDSLETVYGRNDIYILLVLALLCWRRLVTSLAIILVSRIVSNLHVELRGSRRHAPSKI